MNPSRVEGEDTAVVVVVADNERLRDLSPEHRLFAGEVCQLAEKVLMPSRLEESPESYIQAVLDQLSQAGLLGLLVEEDRGGCGGDALCMVLAMEELGAVDAGLAGSISFHQLCCKSLEPYKATNAFEGPLRMLAGGDALGGLALTEPGAGSNPEEITCRAEEAGRERILNGNKCFVCNVGIAPITYLVALCREEAGGLSCYLLSYPHEGLNPIHRYRYLGWETVHSWAMVISGYRLTGDQAVGPPDRGLEVLEIPLRWGRAALAASAIGLARRSLELSLSYARERLQFGVPIGRHQGTAFRLADMSLRVEVCRTSLWRAAGGELGNPALVDISYLSCGEASEFCASQALELHGGLGYTLEGDIAGLYASAKGFRLALGAPDLARLRISEAL